MRRNRSKRGLIFLLTPLAILATAIPVAPGGMGVGHLAFEHTLSLINVSGGANIFNVVFISQMAFNLSGIFPYLMYKKMKGDELS